MGTIFIERLIDLMLVVIIFAFSLFFAQSRRTVFLHNTYIFLLVLILIGLSFFLMLRPRVI